MIIPASMYTPPIPKKTSDIENDSGFITLSDLPPEPVIPTKLSEMENDKGFIDAHHVNDLIREIPKPEYPVLSVNGKVEEVNLNTDDIPEGINKYFTSDRVRDVLKSMGYRKVVNYMGITNSSGEYSIVFETPYDIVPDVQVQVYPNTTANQTVRLTSVSEQGFTVKVEQRNAVSILGIEVLLAITTGVPNANVNVQVTSRS